MKSRFLVIFLIAGLVGARGLLAEEPKASYADKQLVPFDCKKPVPGEFVMMLNTQENSPHQMPELYNDRLVVSTFEKVGNGISKTQIIEQPEFQNALDANNLEIIEVTPVQSMFEDGNNNGKYAENAKGLFREVRTPITRLVVTYKGKNSKVMAKAKTRVFNLERIKNIRVLIIEKIKREQSVRSDRLERCETKEEYEQTVEGFLKQSKSDSSEIRDLKAKLIRLNNTEAKYAKVQKREDFLGIQKDVSDNIRSILENSLDAKFVEPDCLNVEPTTYPPYPPFPWPNDAVFDQYQWGLFNLGVLGGPPAVAIDVNYIYAWQKVKPIWDIYSTNGDILSVIGAGIDDRPGSYQNTDMIDVVFGSYVVSALGGNYYDHLGSDHELAVSGIAVAGNDNLWHITGITRDKIFLSVFNNGIIPLTTANFIDAIDQASLNSEIINASYMISGDYPAIRSILETIALRGDVIVFGAGNDDEDLDNPSPAYTGGYPCRYNYIPGLNINIICSAGIDPLGNLARYAGGSTGSNYGLTKVQIAIPGKDITSTRPGDITTFGSGTSYTAPFVSGLMAMVKWLRPSLSANEIKNLVIAPRNRREAPAPQTLPVVTGGIPDFLKVLNAAEVLIACGDVVRDQTINVLDVLQIARMSAGLVPVQDRIITDVNSDGQISVNDALRVARFIVRLPETLDCPGD